ncbi:MAG: hypothetical protein UZ11_BCD004000156 [Bacteroidetes bacterium OLB11]|nr:MAG: hypothetical protein UZ11_BCD004000156 [Bacteroidetes bacterium OLB11]
MILKEIWQIGIPLYIVELLGNSYTYIAGFIISGYFGENEYAIYKKWKYGAALDRDNLCYYLNHYDGRYDHAYSVEKLSSGCRK